MIAENRIQKENIMTISNLEQLINTAFGDLYVASWPPSKNSSVHSWSPKANSWNPSDLHSDENGYRIQLVIPGVKREEVSVRAEDRTLHVQVNSTCDHKFAAGYTKLSRTWQLDTDADLDNISAVHADGVLTLTVPKVKPKKKVRTVSVS
jgi:HSP20 family protein